VTYEGMTAKLTEVDHDEQRDLWLITCQWFNSDGSPSDKILIMFPKDTMEWRAAEYDIDPADTATLLDMVIAEHMMTVQDWEQDTHLYGAHGAMAVDKDQARKHHIARAARVKLRHRISTRGVDHVLNRVRDESYMHDEALAVKRKLVEHNRDHAMENIINTPDHSDVDRRVLELRNMLPRNKNDQEG